MTTEMDVTSCIQRVLATNKPIPSSASIFHDLGIAGDDAVELLGDIARRFGTSFEGFDFSSHFPDETEALSWQHLASKRKRLATFKPFTVGHLIAVVEKGSWFEQSDTHLNISD